ncbi:MAG: Hsp20/alpha crystallin family protein [Gammaproteobacteria bacterium]|nr:Hsp20/alpha crystallin family protein [Gammaproteobacteria bacterium]
MSKVKEIIPKVVGKESREVGRPFAPLTSSLEEFMENIFPGRWMESMNWRRPLLSDLDVKMDVQWPRVDIIDRENELLIRADLPGVKKDDLELTVTDDSLHVRAETRAKKVEDEESYYRCETRIGAIERFIPLPVDVDSEHVKAELKDGVLEVKMPKRKIVKRHQVEIT